MCHIIAKKPKNKKRKNRYEVKAIATNIRRAPLSSFNRGQPQQSCLLNSSGQSFSYQHTHLFTSTWRESHTHHFSHPLRPPHTPNLLSRTRNSQNLALQKIPRGHPLNSTKAVVSDAVRFPYSRYHYNFPSPARGTGETVVSGPSSKIGNSVRRSTPDKVFFFSRFRKLTLHCIPSFIQKFLRCYHWYLA